MVPRWKSSTTRAKDWGHKNVSFLWSRFPSCDDRATDYNSAFTRSHQIVIVPERYLLDESLPPSWLTINTVEYWPLSVTPLALLAPGWAGQRQCLQMMTSPIAMKTMKMRATMLPMTAPDISWGLLTTPGSSGSSSRGLKKGKEDMNEDVDKMITSPEVCWPRLAPLDLHLEDQEKNTIIIII